MFFSHSFSRLVNFHPCKTKNQIVPTLVAATVHGGLEYEMGVFLVILMQEQRHQTLLILHITEDMLLPSLSGSILAAVDGVFSDADYLAQRAFLCPTNAVMDDINDAVFKRVPGNSRSFSAVTLFQRAQIM